MTKLPGDSVPGSTSGRPVMVLLDALGKRWALRIIWELHQNGPGTFRELQARCEDLSPTSLNGRLRELRDLKLVELGDSGFMLTRHGESLSELLSPIDRWATKWSRSFD